MPTFIPGIELSRLFYFEAVLPILQEHFPGLPHAAARLGDGSDVLGFDTPMSTDHGWGPSVSLFLREEDIHLAPQIREVMSREPALHLPRLLHALRRLARRSGHPRAAIHLRRPDQS